MAEDYHYTSEDAVLFTTQAKGEQSKRQCTCKKELDLFYFHFNWLALKIRLTLTAFCMHHFCPLASPEWCHQWPANLTIMLRIENTSPYITKKIIWILIFTTIVSAPMTMSGDFRWFYSRWMHDNKMNRPIYVCSLRAFRHTASWRGTQKAQDITESHQGSLEDHQVWPTCPQPPLWDLMSEQDHDHHLIPDPPWPPPL